MTLLADSIAQQDRDGQGFDRYGWPLAPDGTRYKWAEIVTDDSIPLPTFADDTDPYWKRREVVQKRKKRRRSRATYGGGRRRWSAADVLGRSMAALVERVNEVDDALE